MTRSATGAHHAPFRASPSGHTQFPDAVGRRLQEITAVVDAGVLRPVLDRVFDFADTAAALEYIDTGRAKGKVVISNADAEKERPGSS